MKKPIIQLILIQFREFYREPGILFWAIVFPIAMAWGLGIAFTSKPEQKRDIAFIQNQSEPDSLFRAILKNYSKPVTLGKEKKLYFTFRSGNEKTGFTVFRFIPSSPIQSDVLLKQGKVIMVVEEINKKLNYHFDPLNTEAKLTYLQLSGVVKSGKPIENIAEIKPLTQKGSRYIDFLIPGLIAMDLMMSTMWGISYSLIEKRSKKLLRRMVATPMRKTSFLFSQLIARFVLNIMEAFIVFFFAKLYFGISIEGNILALCILYVSGMFCFTGLAVLISSRTSNTYVGNGLINAVVMPMMLVSGIFFSYHNFPDAVISIIQALPLTMLADGLRSIFIEGAGFAEVSIKIGILSSLGLIFFVTGIKIYKWY